MKQDLMHCKERLSDQYYLTFHTEIYILGVDNTAFAAYADDNNTYDTGDCMNYFFHDRNVQKCIFQHYLSNQLKPVGADGEWGEETCLSPNIFHNLLIVPTKLERRQCYDEHAVKANKRKILLVEQIKGIKVKTLYLHCFYLALNLAENDSIKHSPVLRKVFETTC